MIVSSACSDITYGVVRNYAVAGYNDKIVDYLTEEQCMQACLNDTDFVCGSADYEFNAARTRCGYTAETRYTQAAAFVFQTNWNHLDPCYGKSSIWFDIFTLTFTIF